VAVHRKNPEAERRQCAAVPRLRRFARVLMGGGDGADDAGDADDAELLVDVNFGKDRRVHVVRTSGVLGGGRRLFLLDALHAAGFTIAIETNGTIPAHPGIDWVCVSPKAQAAVVQTRGQELKLVYPQVGVDPALFESLDFERFYLQPMDGPDQAANTKAAVAYCLAHPRWRLSVQTHKYLGLP